MTITNSLQRLLQYLLLFFPIPKNNRFAWPLLSNSPNHQGSRMELRRSSFYSTLDLVPQLEHYVSTLARQQPRSRPSLEALRRASEVSFSPLGNSQQLASSNLTDPSVLNHEYIPVSHDFKICIKCIFLRRWRRVWRSPPLTQELAVCRTVEMKRYKLQRRSLLLDLAG